MKQTELLVCPVCGDALSRKERAFVCESAHSFDIAKQGYVNLLHIKGGVRGDNALMVNARRRFLGGGYYQPLLEKAQEIVKKYTPSGAAVLDIGCGEGYYTEGIQSALADTDATVYAFDISKEAVKWAAKRRAADFLFVAGAHCMPVSSASMDLALLFFAPFCREEVLRVLKDDGLFLMAYPGERHLYGLKSALYDEPYLNCPKDDAIDGFSVVEANEISYSLALEGTESISDLFMMTPYYYKTSKQDQEKLLTLTHLETEISFHLVLYRKS
ncbi:MAG: methyltransferase domain-containing protein [Clostridia bacterium]|nr:methyltransferase domain-containing protein [Clostridia bacterium]